MQLVSQVLNQQCSQTLAIVVAGFTKVYVGEIIEIGNVSSRGSSPAPFRTNIVHNYSTRSDGRVGSVGCAQTRSFTRSASTVQAQEGKDSGSWPETVSSIKSSLQLVRRPVRDGELCT